MYAQRKKSIVLRFAVKALSIHFAQCPSAVSLPTYERCPSERFTSSRIFCKASLNGRCIFEIDRKRSIERNIDEAKEKEAPKEEAKRLWSFFRSESNISRYEAQGESFSLHTFFFRKKRKYEEEMIRENEKGSTEVEPFIRKASLPMPVLVPNSEAHVDHTTTSLPTTTIVGGARKNMSPILTRNRGDWMIQYYRCLL